MRTQTGAPAGTLGADLEMLASHRVEVHRASGMVSALLGVRVAEALVRLRAHAYAEGRPLADVAADVVPLPRTRGTDSAEAAGR